MRLSRRDSNFSSTLLGSLECFSRTQTMQKISSFSSKFVRSRPFATSAAADPAASHRRSYDGGGRSDELSPQVERIYRTLRQFHSRPPKLALALADAASLPLRPGLVERVLSRCGDAGDLSFRFFSWAAAQPGYAPSPAAYKSMVRSLARMRHFGAAWALVDEMRRDAPGLVSPDLFVALIRRFAAARMVGKAVEVLDEMPLYGCPPDAHVFGCLLDALCKNGSAKAAASLFQDMRERFPPTLRHFTALLYGWCREGKLEEAKHVLVQMKDAGLDPDIVVYNTLLAGYAAAGKMEDGYQLLRDMRHKGCEPNAVSYTTLIQALCSKGRMDDAMRVFVEMKNHGCAPDAVTYNTLISGFCRSGKTVRGREFLNMMVQQGCEPSPSTYFPFFAAYEKKEELEECLELVREMEKARCFPDLGVYNTVIRLACKLGELKAAADVWNEMEATGISPATDTYVITVNGFAAQGGLIEACGYLKEMAGRGLLSVPQYGMLKELLNALLRDEKLELAKEVWDCIVSKGCELNVSAWTIWIHALFSKRHVKEACLYCLDMMDAGVMPQPDTFAKLMKGLKKLYNREIAAEITEKVRNMAAERNVTFKMYKRRGVRALEAKTKAKRDGLKGRGQKQQTEQDKGQGRRRGRGGPSSCYMDESHAP